MNIKDILKRGVIVSCQALEDEPLHSSFIMSKMALAAKLGGAIGIRANSYDDIIEIKKAVELPVIGIVKRDYEDSEIYITPTMREVKEVVDSGAEVVALDATLRKRPKDLSLNKMVEAIRKEYPQVHIMADISTLDEGLNAWKIGFDLISTTLSGYTGYTKGTVLPNVSLIQELVSKVDVPIIAEGGIWTIEDLNAAFRSGAYSAVIGTAITRPREITRRFVNSIKSADMD